MNEKLIKNLTEEMSSFCRANMKRKQNIPIRSSEMGCLIYIVKNADKHGIRSVDLSQYFDIKKSSVSAIVKSLEKQGYISKTESSDKRSNPLIATEKAIKLVNNTFDEYNKLSNTIIDILGEKDALQFMKTLSKVTEIIHKEEL